MLGPVTRTPVTVRRGMGMMLGEIRKRKKGMTKKFRKGRLRMAKEFETGMRKMTRGIKKGMGMLSLRIYLMGSR